MVGHVELRHAEDQRRPQRLRILQETDQPRTLRAAALKGKIRRERSTEAVELVADVAFVALVDSREFTGGTELRVGLRHGQFLEGARRGRPGHAQQRRGHRVEIVRARGEYSGMRAAGFTETGLVILA